MSFVIIVNVKSNKHCTSRFIVICRADFSKLINLSTNRRLPTLLIFAVPDCKYNFIKLQQSSRRHGGGCFLVAVEVNILMRWFSDCWCCWLLVTSSVGPHDLDWNIQHKCYKQAVDMALYEGIALIQEKQAVVLDLGTDYTKWVRRW